MVYESDFYTTRRPYSRTSPTISSYSVTTYPKIPYIAIKRITVPITVAPHGKVRRSVLRGALDRIQHLPRSHVGASAEDEFLNARASVNFDDTVHSIRAQTAALLKRVHTPIPHAVRPLPISSSYKYIETPIPERIQSDAYISVMLLSPNERVRRDIIPMSHYPQTTHLRNSIGRGRLACVSFAAGRVYPKRRLMIFDENNYRNVRNDVQYLSYYNKTRAEAEKQHPKIKLDEEAKLREEPIIKPAYPTHTHVSFQTPLKTEEQILKPTKTTEPVYSDDAENVFQKEEEIDAWLTHQKKKKSKKDAENNEDQLNEELAAKEEELTRAEPAVPESESKPVEPETLAEESTEEIKTPAQELETQSQAPVSPQQSFEVEEETLPPQSQEIEEEAVIEKDTEFSNEPQVFSEPENEVENVPKEATDPKEEEIVPASEETTRVSQDDQEEVKEQGGQNEEFEDVKNEEDIEIVEVEEQIEQEYNQDEEEKEQVEENAQKNNEDEEKNEPQEEQIEHEEKETESNVENTTEIETNLEETEVEPTEEPELQDEKEEAPKPESTSEDVHNESVREEIDENDAEEITENSLKNEILADKSVAEIRKVSEDKDCSTLEHKDNDGPKSDTEISDLEEDECAVQQKVSVKDTLNLAVDTNLDDSSLVDDVFEAEAPETPAENKTQPEITTDEECEEDSE